MARGEPQIKFRFPVDVHQSISSAAESNGRSMNAEIVSRIRKSLENDPVNRNEDLRDKFAMAAISGMLSHSFEDGSDWLHDDGAASASQWAYKFADAMMTARKGGAS